MQVEKIEIFPLESLKDFSYLNFLTFSHYRQLQKILIVQDEKHLTYPETVHHLPHIMCHYL